MTDIRCTRNGKTAIIEGHDMGLLRDLKGRKVFMTRYVLEKRGEESLEFYSTVDAETVRFRTDLAAARWEADCANLAEQGVTEAEILLEAGAA